MQIVIDDSAKYKSLGHWSQCMTDALFKNILFENVKQYNFYCGYVSLELELVMQHMINILDSDTDVSTPSLRAARVSDLKA